MNGDSDQQLYLVLQDLFTKVQEFDQGMVFAMRRLLYNIIEPNRSRCLNDMPLEYAAFDVDDSDLESYLENVLSKMGQEARGFLLSIAPVALRINIFVINIDSSTEARVRLVEY